MDLYRYQAEEGVPWLAGRPRAYLAYDCGLGKTVVAAAAARRIGAVRTLVVAPASAIPNWLRDWGRWGPDVEAEVVSYDSLARHPHVGLGYDLAILDEAHYVKSPKAKRTKAALDVAAGAARAWLLSATPAPNHLGELYAPIKKLWPGILRQLGISNALQWQNRFTIWGPGFKGRGVRVFGSRNEDQLQPFLRRMMLVRKLEEVGIDSPPLRVDVSLMPHDTRFERALGEYEAAALLAGMEQEGDADSGSVSRLRRYLGEYKAPYVADLLAEELEAGAYKKLVVLAHHRNVIHILERRLAKYETVVLTGDSTRKQRAHAEDTFRRAARGVFIGQQTAAGVALNLQTASEIVLLEPSWVPDENWQAIKRIHRIGSESPCRARMFAVKGTLDEAIISTQARKTRAKAGFKL